MDDEARWAGDSLVLPRLGVRLHLEVLPIMQNVQLASTGGRQSLDGWHKLESELRRSLGTIETTPNPRGPTLMAVAMLICLLIAFSLVQNQQAVQQALREMLR